MTRSTCRPTSSAARSAALALAGGLATALAAAIASAGPAAAANFQATIEDNLSHGCVAGMRGQGSTYCYLPENLPISPGDTVTWTNNSTATSGHTVTRCNSTTCPAVGPGDGDASVNFGSPTLNKGDTFQKAFAKGGTYNYVCAVHGYEAMHGSVTVSGTPVTSGNPSSGGTTGGTGNPNSGASAPASSPAAAASTGTTGTTAAAATPQALAKTGAGPPMERDEAPWRRLGLALVVLATASVALVALIRGSSLVPRPPTRTRRP